MRVHIRYFAAARDAAGVAGEELVLDEERGAPTVAAVRAALLRLRPTLERVLAQSRLAVDQRFAAETDTVAPGAEVAVIPPVAGG